MVPIYTRHTESTGNEGEAGMPLATMPAADESLPVTQVITEISQQREANSTTMPVGLAPCNPHCGSEICQLQGCVTA